MEGPRKAHNRCAPFNSGCVNALRTFQDAYDYVGAKIIGMVYGSAEAPGEIKSNTDEDIQKLWDEARAYTTNMSYELWGPSPVVPEPIRPGQ